MIYTNMVSIRTFVFIVTVVMTCEGIEIPNKGWVNDHLGILMEPDSLIIHYDKVIYNTVGVRFALLPPLETVTNKTDGGCNLGSNRLNALKNFNRSIEEFFQTIPNHFSDFTDHYCKDRTIDCYLNRAGTDASVAKRDKRQAFVALIAMGGLAAIGTGLFHMFSDKELSKHLDTLDKKIQSTIQWIKDSSTLSNQYKELTENLFTKMYHGMMNNENLLAKSLCKIADDEVYDSIYLHYTMFFESYKDNFLKAMDGKVTEFLVGYDFLVSTILKNPALANSAYKIDPGLFYVASSAILTRVDYTHRIAYFTITTPVLQEMDVSPLYRIYSMGWWEDEHLVRLDVPKYGYFLTDKEQVEIAAPTLDKCRQSRGIYLCHLRDSQLSHQAVCMTSLVRKGDSKECTLTIRYGKKSCVYEVARGGVMILGCPEVSKMSTFRGIPRKQDLEVDENHAMFLSYSNFKQLSINNNVVSSRGTYINHIQDFNLTRPTTNLSDIIHLVIPGIEQNINELRASREKSRDTTEGFIKDLMSKHKEEIGWFWYFIGVCGVLNFLLLMKTLLEGCQWCKRENSRDGLASILEMRKMRQPLD